MMGLITGYWVSQAVGVVALLGVADQLDEGPRGSDELARAVGADPQALYRVLRLLASLGVFAEAADVEKEAVDNGPTVSGPTVNSRRSGGEFLRAINGTSRQTSCSTTCITSAATITRCTPSPRRTASS